MKTTIEIPDALFRRAKATAAGEGKSLKEFVTEAVAAKLGVREEASQEPPWMGAFGGLAPIPSGERSNQSSD
ncbi:MAG: hypothetical protein R2729_17235 [Bryobacteraceae bacterium]